MINCHISEKAPDAQITCRGEDARRKEQHEAQNTHRFLSVSKTSTVTNAVIVYPTEQMFLKEV